MQPIPTPNTLYVVVDWTEHDHDGNTAGAYLIKRYKPGEFGFFPPSDGRIVFFYDQGHRDEFHRRFGGLTGMAERKIKPLEGMQVKQALRTLAQAGGVAPK